MPTMDASQLIKDLREKTGAGMMDCKRALDEAKGNLEAAIVILRKKGMADAAKKSTRATKEGSVDFKTDGKSGAIVEINCETDFVSKGSDFQGLVKTLVDKVFAGALKSVESANDELVKPLVGKLGENMALKRFERYELKGPGLVSCYKHQTDPSVPAKSGAMIELSAPASSVGSAELAELAKSLLLQIVGASPKYLTRSEVPASEIEKEKEIAADKLRKDGKPEAQIPKIIEGMINKKFYQEWVLLEQISQQDTKSPISEILKQAGAKLGGEIKVVRFARYQLGQ